MFFFDDNHRPEPELGATDQSRRRPRTESEDLPPLSLSTERGNIDSVLARLAHPDPALTDGVVELRPWRYDDVGCVEATSRDPRIPAGTTVPGEYSQVEGRAFIERQWGRHDNREGLSLAIADTATGEACGLIVLLHRADRSTLGLGYWVVPDSRAKGFASRAVALLVPWALGQPSIAEIEAIVELDNDTSRRVLEKAGFVQVGDAEVDGRPALRLAKTR